MNWFAALFKRKEPGTVNDRYAMKLSVCHETYTVEEFDLQFKRNTDRDGLPEGEAYGGFVTCTLAGMPGDGLLRWGAYSQPARTVTCGFTGKTSRTRKPYSSCVSWKGTASVCSVRLTV